MAITEASIIHHVGIVLLFIWLLSSFNCCHSLIYFFSFIYLYLVHDVYAMRFRKKVEFEERKQANQKRVLSDSESVRWLNHTIERVWPICMEEIVSQRILLPIVPWFLQKYKPWTVKEAVVQNMYLGRSPPMFTEMRVCRQSNDDDHLVMELGINFRTADDMSAILAVKMTRRLGFGMWAKMHLTGMHVEGKVLVGVKFLPKWPYLGRLRMCFVEPPYFQMTVKPIFSHGLNVTELPGIAGWLDKLLTVAFEETLVEPNMMVVDVEKFVSPEPETWFSVDAKEPVAYMLVEIVEASDMKPADMNGLADPYVKGQLGAYRFRTKIQRKTLSPKWQEEFKIPINTWDLPNVLTLEVRDKDYFVDDALGECSVKINDLIGGKRHDMWLPLQNIKTGRLHLAITVADVNVKVTQPACDGDSVSSNEFKKTSFANETDERGASFTELPEKSPQVADDFEPIDIEGQRETGIWVHRPGSEIQQLWEPRKGKDRVQKDTESVGSSMKSDSCANDSSSSDESPESNKRNPVRRGLHNIRSFLHRSPKTDNSNKSRNFSKGDDEIVDLHSPHPNVRAENAKGVKVNLVMEDNDNHNSILVSGQDPEVENEQESPNKRNVKGMAKSILKHAGNSARTMKHAMSHKGAKAVRDRDLIVELGSSGEGSIASPVCEPEVEASPDVPNTKSEDVPGLESKEVATDSMGPTGEVKADDQLETVAENVVDANESDTVGADGSESTARFPMDQT